MNSNTADHDFAWIYNKHWGPYASQALYILDELILNHIPKGARILDLCCGTGQLSAKLGGLGYPVTGIDISEDMLRFARKNAPEAKFILANAKEFKPAEMFDCVVSTYDSLNFIISLEELSTVFQNVHLSLHQNGIFLFDLNTEYGYLYHWDDGILSFVEDDHACTVRAAYDFDEKLSRLDTTIFRLLDGWQRSDLTFYQKFHSESDVQTALELAGFTNIVVHGYNDEQGLSDLNEESERMYFVCRKSSKSKI